MLRSLSAWARRHPTRAVALLALLVPVVAAYLPPVVGTLLGPALAIIIGKPLHDAVTPELEAVRRVTAAATEVGVEVARQLGPEVVGAVGDITGDARALVGDVVGRVLPG